MKYDTEDDARRVFVGWKLRGGNYHPWSGGPLPPIPPGLTVNRDDYLTRFVREFGVTNLRDELRAALDLRLGEGDTMEVCSQQWSEPEERYRIDSYRRPACPSMPSL